MIVSFDDVKSGIYKASCWDCQDFYIGKTKRRLHDRKTEQFKGITSTCLQLVLYPAGTRIHV